MTTRSLALIGLVTSVSNTNSAAQPKDLASQPVIERTAPAQGPRLRFAPVSDAYSVSGAASALVGGSQITRRKSGFNFATGMVARPRFATSDGPKAIAQLRDLGGRFFRGVRKAPDDPLDASVFRTAQPLAGLPFLSLSLGDSDWSAVTLPQSGAFLLHRPDKVQRPTPIQNTEQAIAVALQFISDNGFLSPASNEALDLIDVSAIYRSEGDETQVRQVSKVGHHVAFGRKYRGVPVDGGFVLVVLNSDGEVSTIHKAWRDIVGEVPVEVANESTILGRRDPIKVNYLIQKDRSCAFTEDLDSGATQDAAGVGCKFTYDDPAGERGSRTIVEWVNVAKDETLPLKGVRR